MSMVTIVLWQGQYRADGLERLAIVQTYDRALSLRNPRLRGAAGDWRLVADAAVDHTALVDAFELLSDAAMLPAGDSPEGLRSDEKGSSEAPEGEVA